MSSVRRKPILFEQKQRRKPANDTLSPRSALSPDTAPRNLRVFCDQIEAGNEILQTHIRELANAATTIMEGISAFKIQLAQESRQFHILWSVIASFLGKSLDGVSAGAVRSPSPSRTRAFPTRNSTYTALKGGQKRSRPSNEDEIDSFAQKRPRLFSSGEASLPFNRELQFDFQRQKSTSNGSPKTVLKPDCSTVDTGNHWHPLSFSSPISVPTNYSKLSLPKTLQLKTRPPLRVMRHVNWFFEKYDYRAKRWLFIRDRRALEKWKILEEKEQESAWKRDGNLQSNLKLCCQSVNTAYQFEVDWKDYDVPYTGDDNILTPSHPDYPPELRSKPPPERRQ